MRSVDRLDFRERLMPIRSVVVLLHQNDQGFQGIHYLIKPLIEAWQAAGIQVDVMRGLGRRPPADVLVPHLDLTITPRPYRRFFDRYALVVNRQLVDISKSRISTNLVGPHDSHAGPVIVKTDRNYGGLPEQHLTPGSPLTRAWHAIAGRPSPSSRAAPLEASGWKHLEALEPSAYPVFSSLGEVPREVFANHRLVVEKFIPERDGTGFAIRYFYFLGQASLCYRLRSTEPATKFSNAHSIERVPAPVALQAYRLQHGLDFGKIDFVMRDGEPVVLDVNRTPALRPDAQALAGEIVATLAGGLQSLVNG